MANTGDTPDLVTPTDEKKPFLKSSTIWFILAAGVLNIASNVARAQGVEWLADALDQAQLLIFGPAMAARAVATKPLR